MNNKKQLQLLHRQFKNLLEVLPNEDYKCRESIVNSFHQLVEILINITSREDYESLLKLTSKDTAHGSGRDKQNCYNIDTLKTKVGLALGTVEGELDVNTDSNAEKNVVNILNKNENAVEVTIEQTISELINKENNPETKEKLSELENALKNKDKNKVISVIKYLTDKSFDLLIAALPAILQTFTK